MRHKKTGRRLGRNSDHRKAMFRNMAVSLIVHESISTTLPKAKELRRTIEPLITLAKEDGVAKRRRAFDKLRDKKWFIAPLTSSLFGSVIDTFLFFSISFYGTEMNWVSLSLGDLTVKIIVTIAMLIPFRFLMKRFMDISSIKKVNLS